MQAYLRYSNPYMVDSNDAKIVVSFAMYELGKLLSDSELAKRRLQTRSKYKVYQDIQQECEISINYFNSYGQVIKNMLELKEILEGFSPSHIMKDPSLQLIQIMPSTFEEMIDTMDVLYRCFNDF